MTAPPHLLENKRGRDPAMGTLAQGRLDAERIARLEAESEVLRQENAELRRGEAERKRMEDALRESEEKYARFFWDDLTGDSLASADGRILACNPAFLPIFRFSSFDEALASNIQSLYPDPGIEPIFCTCSKRRGHSTITR
ncbi:MAG: PAS domain-containing protein [Methanoculleus sp.]|nr:PAS domain-containing protein [Methanoculleus sp.]